jgi:ABC-2 type transport system ATP-binding protein
MMLMKNEDHLDNVIVVSNLTKHYRDFVAIDHISFEVRRGEIFGLLGPNGAGKTTTVEILEGMLTADSGTALVNDIDVSNHPEKVKSIIGIQLQTASFFDHLSLTEIVKLYGTLYGRKVDPLGILTKVDLLDKAKSFYAPLSGGQKQRLSIGVALVNEPEILFLDEPTTGLDPQARRHMWELIENIRSGGTTVVLTTHYMEEAEELCDRVAILDHGNIIALDTPATLIEQLLRTGFQKKRDPRPATLEDVFLRLTSHQLRED